MADSSPELRSDKAPDEDAPIICVDVFIKIEVKEARHRSRPSKVGAREAPLKPCAVSEVEFAERDIEDIRCT